MFSYRIGKLHALDNGYALSRYLCLFQRYVLVVIVRCFVVVAPCFNRISIAGALQSVYRSLDSLFTSSIDPYIVGIL